MQFRVLSTGYTTTDVDEVIDYCISEDFHTEDDDYFEDWVNDTYDGTEIAGVDYSPYEILKQFERVSDVLDSYCQHATENDYDNARYELLHADVGERIYIQDYEVICEEEVEEQGDVYDCDGDALERLREEIETERMCIETAKKMDEQEKDAYLNLFQTIGA